MVVGGGGGGGVARQLVLGTEVALIMADPLMHYAWPGGRDEWGGGVVVVGEGGC